MSREQLSDIVSQLLDGMHGVSRSETIVGEPLKAGDATVIPIHRLKIAFGAASASAGAHGARVDGDTGASGVGGAVELDPVAAIAVDKHGDAHVLPVDGERAGGLSQVLRDAPDLIAKVAQSLGQRVAERLQGQLGEGQTSGLEPQVPEGSALKAEALPGTKADR